jgi:hypothetical protein
LSALKKRKPGKPVKPPVKPPKRAPLTKKQEDFIREMEGITGKAYGHGGRPAKLAMLCFKSNHSGLQKEASEALWNPQEQTYNDFIGTLAASSPMASLGISETAIQHLTSLEKIGCDVDELAEHVLGETIQADIYMEACFAKVAGVEEPFEKIAMELEAEIWDELGLEKASVAAVAIPAAKLWKAIATPAKATRAVAAMRRGVSRVTTPIKGKWRGWRTGRKIKKHKVITGPMEKLKDARRQARLAIRSPKITEVERAQLSANVENLTKQIRKLAPAQMAAGRAMTKYQRALAAKAGESIPRIPGGGPRARASIEAGRAARAKAQASAAKGERGAREAAEKAERGLGKGEVAAGAERYYQRGSRKGEPIPGTHTYYKGTRYVGPERATVRGAPPARGPKPPPASAVEGKGVGVRDAYKRWTDVGWDKLTGTEKRKLIQAGVLGFAAQRVVLGKEHRVI